MHQTPGMSADAAKTSRKTDIVHRKHCFDQSRQLMRYRNYAALMLATAQCNRIRTRVPSRYTIYEHFRRRCISRLPVRRATKPLTTRQGFEHRWPSSHSGACIPSVCSA